MQTVHKSFIINKNKKNIHKDEKYPREGIKDSVEIDIKSLLNFIIFCHLP